MGTARGKRDRAILALLIGCGLSRAELVALKKGRFPAPRRSLGDLRKNASAEMTQSKTPTNSSVCGRLIVELTPLRLWALAPARVV